jgi:hypothetical protein
MATAAEKEAKQAARDVAASSITQGQERLAAVGKAASAFPQRRLRASGDLSRYAIGGFLSDALPPIGSPAPVVKPAAKAKTAPTPRKVARRTIAPAKKPITTRRVSGQGASAWYES